MSLPDHIRQPTTVLLLFFFRAIRIMEGLLHYINPAHAISLLSTLNEERLKGQLCDVVLIVGDQKFRAHKNVLAASSEYFQTLFTNKENESQSVFQLDFCEPDAFDNVLNYIYSSSLFIEKGSLAACKTTFLDVNKMELWLRLLRVSQGQGVAEIAREEWTCLQME